jgi:hypothetical protein
MIKIYAVNEEIKKPSCYKETNLADIGKEGIGCLCELDYTSGNDSPILGELKRFDIEEKCKTCEFLLK